VQIVAQVTGITLRIAQEILAQPDLVKWHAERPAPDLAEGVDIALAQPAPVDEFDAKLERAHRFGNELVLVDMERAVEVEQRGWLLRPPRRCRFPRFRPG
jgi:hypothetical protein